MLLRPVKKSGITSQDLRMAFDRPRTTFTNSLFSIESLQREPTVNAGGWSNGNVAGSFGSIANVSLHNQDMLSSVPWSHKANDDSYDLINCARNIKCRTSHTPACDGETDLQRLVSNIVDDTDSQDSFFSEGNSVQCNPIWSSKMLQEELPQYFQSEDKTQNGSAFPTNCVSHKSFSKIQGKAIDGSEFYKQSNGLPNQLFNFNNGDGDIYTLRSQNPPPGLPVPNITNGYLLQKQKTYDTMALNKNPGNGELMNHFSHLSDVYGSQCEKNSPFIDSHSLDHYSQAKSKRTGEQYMPQDVNQLVSSFQSFMAGSQQDTAYCCDFPNMHMQSAMTQHEDRMAWINNSSVPQRKSASTQIQKQPGAEYGSMQRVGNGEMRQQMLKRDVPQDPPGFGPQNREYFWAPKPDSVSLYPSNQYQNKMTVNRRNMSLPIDMNQYSKHHTQVGQMQNKIKPQMQEKKRMAILFGKQFSTVPLTDNEMVPKEKKQALSLNSFDFTDGRQTFYEENGIRTQHFTRLDYSINYPRGHSNLPIKPNFSKSTAAFETGVSGMKLSGMSPIKPAGLNSSLSDRMSCREGNTHHSIESIMTPPRMKRQREPESELNLYLDECCEQWRCLVKERKKTEVILSKIFLGNWTAGENNPSLPKTSANATGLDRLIMNQLREQALVANLLDKVEYLCCISLQINIRFALFRHFIAIHITHARSKEEVAHMSQHQNQAGLTEERDGLKLVVALKDLIATTSKLRTGLVRTVQKALPKPKCLEQHVPLEKCPSLVDGCSFKL